MGRKSPPIKVTADIVDRFLRKMLPAFPGIYDPSEREILMRDTTIQEIKRFAPELMREWLD